ncbi:hypothetical protein B0T21DRAFT_397078 [Apiosordaria backusii]|uniref:Uncharacterized protein n=1 Tax=Apiosordaria backusii TaxID=314023 RepID=A0AA40DLN4_9PEZI|nr:hypothetical protein B0T21DRAFT_397078 [Apiosordaria backusii]
MLRYTTLLLSILVSSSSSQSTAPACNTSRSPTWIQNITSPLPMVQGNWTFDGTRQPINDDFYAPWKTFPISYSYANQNSRILLVQIPTPDNASDFDSQLWDYYKMPVFVFNWNLTSLLYVENVRWNQNSSKFAFPRNQAVQFKAPPSAAEFVSWMKGNASAKGPDISTGTYYYLPGRNDTANFNAPPETGPRDASWRWLGSRWMHSFDHRQGPTNSTVLGAHISCT